MVADRAASPSHDPELVEHTFLEEAIDLHPTRLTIGEWVLRIAGDPLDDSEVETIKHAIRDLRHHGLVRYRNDDRVVEPTQAALRAHALLTGVPVQGSTGS